MLEQRFFIVALLSILLSACENQELSSSNGTNKNPAAENTLIIEGDIVATLNNRKISSKELAVYAQFNDSDQTSTANDKEILHQLIDIELWAQEARNKKLDHDIEKILRVQLLTKQFYAEQAKKHLLLTKPLTKEQIKAEYDKRYGQDNLQQVKIRIIELSDQEKIEQLLNSLKMGADFKELARLAQNTDSLSQETDWIALNSLTPEQIQALSKIEDGQFTREVIQSESGWQILLKESSRIAPAPSFKDVRQELVTALQREQLILHTRVLRDATVIQIAGESSPEQQEQPATDEPIEATPVTKAPDVNAAGKDDMSSLPASSVIQTE
jgi:peptidyl-prolyl cis-trans isomerase C